MLVYYAGIEGIASEGIASEGIASEGIAGVIGIDSVVVGVGVVDVNSRKRVLKVLYVVADIVGILTRR